MAPDFERLARMPWPIATLASSGTSLLSSALACSCSAWADRVGEKTAANSAQALEELMSTMRTASMRGFGGSTPNRRRGLAALHAAPEFPLGGDNQMLIGSCGMYFSAATSSVKDQGSMNLASNTAPLASTRPSRVAPIQRRIGWHIRRWTSVMTCPYWPRTSGGSALRWPAQAGR